jgi:hypothetical protein
MTEENNVPSLEPLKIDEKEEEVILSAGYSSGNEDEVENKFIEISVPKSEIKYDLKPQVIGDNNIKFYNAQDLKYYDRLLKEPVMTMWLLTGISPYRQLTT